MKNTFKALENQHVGGGIAVNTESKLVDTAVGGTHAVDVQFLRDGRWARVFTPTITHALYISREPFLEWTSESPVFLATVQHIFNISFSNVTLVLSAKDPLLETVWA